jgi:hypothetical protein
MCVLWEPEGCRHAGFDDLARHERAAAHHGDEVGDADTGVGAFEGEGVAGGEHGVEFGG